MCEMQSARQALVPGLAECYVCKLWQCRSRAWSRLRCRRSFCREVRRAEAKAYGDSECRRFRTERNCSASPNFAVRNRSGILQW